MNISAKMLKLRRYKSLQLLLILLDPEKCCKLNESSVGTKISFDTAENEPRQVYRVTDPRQARSQLCSRLHTLGPRMTASRSVPREFVDHRAEFA